MRYDFPAAYQRSLIWFASAAHGLPPRFVSRRGAPGRSEVSPRPGLLVSRRPNSPAPYYVDTAGLSQVSRRSIPCLCCVPGPRSNRRVLVIAATSMPPPRSGRRGLRHWLISRLTPAALAPALLRFALPLLSRARLASGWLTGLYREGVEPLWTTMEGFSSYSRPSSFPVLLTLPDCTIGATAAPQALLSVRSCNPGRLAGPDGPGLSGAQRDGRPAR